MGELRGGGPTEQRGGGGGGGGPTGADREAGVGERGGDIQREHVLHVPRHQEALLRHGREPDRARAGRGSKRQGPRTRPHAAPRNPLGCPCRLHRWQACRNHGPGHGMPHQRHPCSSPQRSRCSLALKSRPTQLTLSKYK